MTPYLFRIIKSDRKSWLKFLMCKKAPWSTFSISDLVSGTSLTLNNSIRRALAELNIMGNSIQDGEPSLENPAHINSVGDNVQLFDKDNANIMTANLSNYTKISNNSPSNKTLYMEIKPNTTYTISKVLSNYFTIGTTETEPQFAMDYQQNKYNANAKSLTITTSSTAKYLLVWYWNSADTLTEEQIRNSIKIEQGSIASPYSPYGMGCASIKKCNKNLFDGANPVYVANKILNDNGVETADQTGGYTKMYIAVKPNTTYTISGMSEYGSKRIYYFNKLKSFIFRTDRFGTTYNTFTTPSNCYYVDFQYFIEGNDFTDYQLEPRLNSHSIHTTPKQNL